MKNCYCEKIFFDKMTPMRTMYTHPLDICMKKFYCQNNFCGKQLSCGGYLISIAYCLFFHLYRALEGRWITRSIFSFVLINQNF